MAGKITILDGFPADILAVSGEGMIDGSAYETVLIPEIEHRLRRHDQIKLLYILGEGFEGFTAHAAWDDARLGMTHLHDFSRIALVTDTGWIAQSARLFAPLIPALVRVFSTDQLAAAKGWIAEEEPTVFDGSPPVGDDENFPV